MVLNSNHKPTDDPNLQQLRQIDSSRVHHLGQKIDDLKSQLDGIEKVRSLSFSGFLISYFRNETFGIFTSFGYFLYLYKYIFEKFLINFGKILGRFEKTPSNIPLFWSKKIWNLLPCWLE